VANIQILLGTVNGRALQCAQAVAVILERFEHSVEINTEPEVIDLTTRPDEILLVCCSTTGDGQLPRELFPTFLALEDGAVDLTGRHYGVIALGDRGYPQFASAGLKMEAVLYRSGAKRVGDIFLLDAQAEDNQPVAAAMWAAQWQQQLPEDPARALG